MARNLTRKQSESLRSDYRTYSGGVHGQSADTKKRLRERYWAINDARRARDRNKQARKVLERKTSPQIGRAHV